MSIFNFEMLELEILNHAIMNCAGIYIRNDSKGWDKKDILLLSLYDQFNMQKFIDGQEGTVYFNPLLPLLKINMPCGRNAVYRSLDEIPNESTHCPCGNPNHWLIKYEDIVDDKG